MIKYELLIVLHKLKWYYKKYYKSTTWSFILITVAALTVTLRSCI